jgi:LPXTG-motif cell wall-anchored protein
MELLRTLSSSTWIAIVVGLVAFAALILFFVLKKKGNMP